MMAWFVTMDSRNRNSEDETYLSPAIDQIPEEQDRYEKFGKAFGQKLIDDYRATGKNPYQVDLIGSTPDHPWWSPGYFPNMMKGWRWPMPSQPFRNKLTNREGRLVDVIGTSFETYAISQRVIDIIEAIEPGVHQYLPYELICKDGTDHPDKRWLLNVCTRLQAFDLERSNLKVAPGRVHLLGDGFGAHKLVVRKEAVENRAIWYEYKCQFTTPCAAFTLSDRFWDALGAAGCAGWRPAPYDLGRHIEEV
jgi:hypothetical protein